LYVLFVNFHVIKTGDSCGRGDRGRRQCNDEIRSRRLLDICCFLSSPFLVQNDFRSRPLGSTGARGVIHLANKIQLSQNKFMIVIDCYVVQRQTQMEAGDAFVDEGWSGDHGFLVNQFDGPHQFV